MLSQWYLLLFTERSFKGQKECFSGWSEEGEHQMRMNVWEGGDGESLDFGSD